MLGLEFGCLCLFLLLLVDGALLTFFLFLSFYFCFFFNDTLSGKCNRKEAINST